MQMQMIARGYLTYDLTASPFLLGLVNAGFALPMLGLALFGGAIADRMEVALIPIYFVAVGVMVMPGLGDAGRRTRRSSWGRSRTSTEAG